MIEWQNEASLFVVRIQGKQWYWAYKYNSDTNYRLQNLFINVGHNNWFKTTTPSHRLFSCKNNTLIFIYEYEFKKLHKFILSQKGRSFSKINKLVNTTHSSETNYQENAPVTLKTFFKQNKHNTQINLYKTSWTLSGSTNLFNALDITNSVTFSVSSAKIIPQPSQIISNILNNRNLASKFETDILDDLDESAENLRIKLSNFPVKLIKGTLNSHNINILNSSESLSKNIFLNYRINNATVTEKISQIEQFWGFRQKKYKKLRSFSFPQNYKFNNKTYTPIKNFIQNDSINKYNLYTGIRTTRNKSESNSIAT